MAETNEIEQVLVTRDEADSPGAASQHAYDQLKKLRPEKLLGVWLTSEDDSGYLFEVIRGTIVVGAG